MKKNSIYIILILALVVSTFINVSDRMAVESTAKSAEITLSYDDFDDLSKQSEEDVVWWFNHFSKIGIQSVSLTEESLHTLVESGNELELEVLHNLKKDTLWETRYPKSFVEYIQTEAYDLNDVVVVSEDQELKEFILNGLSERYPEEFYQVFENGDHYAILLDGLESELRYSPIYKTYDTSGNAMNENKDIVESAIYYYGIDFDSTKIENIQKGNLEVNLRPWNNMRYPEKLIEAYDNTLKEFDITPRMLIFSGKEVLGYPDDYVALYEYMTEHDIVPVLIETTVQRSNTEQQGIMQLTKDMNYNAVRLMPMVEYLQERYQHYNYDGGEEIENVMFRAITERNIRVIYFRPFLIDKETYVTDAEEYTKTFAHLATRLEDHNMTLGEFSVMDYKSDNLTSGIITGFGLLSIVILAARFFFRLPSKVEYILLLLGGILIAAALVVAPNLGRQLLALTGAMTISSLGAVILVSFARDLLIDKRVFKVREIILRSILFTLMMGLLALLGGMIVGGLLSHSKYLLEIEFFRGVKISEILPLAIFIVLYLLKFGYNRTTDEIKNTELLPKDLFRFLNINIKVVYLLAAGAGAAVLYIYIARSGHETTVQPSNIEMIFRNFLELKLLARPRLKEFFLAVPALMIFSYVSYKAYKPLIALVGIPAMITFTSVINTFCHLRTPIYLSVIRTLIGIGFGIIIGLIGIFVCELIERLIKRYRKRYFAYDNDQEKELGA